MHNFCVWRLALSDITSINASVLLEGFTLSAVKMKLHSSLCTRADQMSHRALDSGDLSRNPPKICFPVPSPQAITCDSSSQSLHYREHGMGSKQASPSVWEASGTTVDNPRHSLSGSTCGSGFGRHGESLSPWAQWCSSLTASCSAQKYFYLVLSDQTGPDAANTASAFFGDHAEILGALWIFGLKAWYPANSGWLYQLRFACLLFFNTLNLFGILLTNPNFAFWVTLYLLNFEVRLALGKKKRHYSPTMSEVVHAAVRVRCIEFFI